MTKISTPPWPNYKEEEIEAVKKVLRSGKVNYWTGHVTKDFETAFAAWCSTRHAIAVSNGTVALDLCLHGLGVGAHNGGHAEDEVIVTPRSFIASASVIINAGATPVFVDVDPTTFNIDPSKIEDAITDQTKAILAVHVFSNPCDVCT